MQINEVAHRTLDDAHGLGGCARSLTADARLLGARPELVSTAAPAPITAIEEQHGFDDDGGMNGESFSTAVALPHLVHGKIAV